MGFYSWEEIGKAVLILDHHNEDFITKKMWKDSYCHFIKIAKARRAIDLSLMASQGLEPEYIEKFRKGEYELVSDEEFLEKMHDLRTKGLYIHYNFNENKWEIPTIITDELAITVINQAGLAVRAFEIELDRTGIKLE